MAAYDHANLTECFSALQRAEIAEMVRVDVAQRAVPAVSVLFNEPKLLKSRSPPGVYGVSGSFSALQRAEIAEIPLNAFTQNQITPVSVLFNEPKLLKLTGFRRTRMEPDVSVLFNEPKLLKSKRKFRSLVTTSRFQCSSTSRNC